MAIGQRGPHFIALQQAEIERLHDVIATCRELRKWDREAVIEECLAALHHSRFPYTRGEAAIGLEFARRAIRRLKDKPL